MSHLRIILLFSFLAFALVLTVGCGGPTPTPVLPTKAPATATTVPTKAPIATPVPPTVVPTPIAPTTAPTIKATATKPRVVPSRTPTKVVATATPTPKYVVPAGKAGLLVRNFFGQPLNYTIAEKQYKIPANSEQFIVLDPGKYPASGNILGQVEDWETVDLQVNKIVTSDWFGN
jgi:hypothetical protein